jgi:hypothetical protein
MMSEFDTIASDLAELFKTEFGGRKTGRYAISKANLRALAKRSRRLEPVTLEKIIASAVTRHGLLLIPLNGTLETAKMFGLMKTYPDWPEVPDDVVAAQAAAG